MKRLCAGLNSVNLLNKVKGENGKRKAENIGAAKAGLNLLFAVHVYWHAISDVFSRYIINEKSLNIHIVTVVAAVCDGAGT